MTMAMRLRPAADGQRKGSSVAAMPAHRSVARAIDGRLRPAADRAGTERSRPRSGSAQPQRIGRARVAHPDLTEVTAAAPAGNSRRWKIGWLPQRQGDCSPDSLIHIC